MSLVRLGIRVGNNQVQSHMNAHNHLYDRFGGDYGVEQYENWIRATDPVNLSDYRVKSHRGSYALFGNNADWPQNLGTEGRWQRDINEGRTVVASIGRGETPSNASIDQRGDQLRDFLTSNAGQYEGFVMTYWHEPNISNNPGAWWPVMQNIMTRWDAVGVPRWEGLQDGTCTTPGVIYAGPNLAGLTGTGASVGEANFDYWYPASNSFAWSNEGITMANTDIYPGGNGGGKNWRAITEQLGISAAPQSAGNCGFLSWFQGPRKVNGGGSVGMLGRQQIQNNAGRVLLGGIFEYAHDHYDKMWSSTEGASGAIRYFDAISTYWSNTLALGTPTVKKQLDLFAAFLTANPNIFYTINYWDSCAGANTRGAHMLDIGAPALQNVAPTAGTDTQMRDQWVEFIKTPIFGYVGTVVPPASSKSGFGIVS